MNFNTARDWWDTPVVDAPTQFREAAAALVLSECGPDAGRVLGMLGLDEFWVNGHRYELEVTV